MGIAGVAVLYAIFCVIRIVMAVGTFFAWHNKEIVTAEVGEIKGTEEAGKKDYKFTLPLVLDTLPEKITRDYTEVAARDDKLSIKPGDKIEVYYDPGKEEDKQVKIKSQVIRELWMWPVFLIVCVGIFIGCMALAGALSKK